MPSSRSKTTAWGIPEDNLSRIFEPFFTTRPVAEGTGLGLHVARRIVESVGGSIEVKSRPGRTVFRLLFRPTDRGTPRSEPVSSAQPSLLVVDDDERVARVVAMMCSDDYQTRVVLDPADALQLIRQQRFDAILCDVMMPAMNGWQLLRRAEELRPGVRERFVMMSGASADQHRPEGFEHVELLPKPFSHLALLERIKAVQRPSEG